MDILVVEDDMLSMNIVTRTLEGMGHTVIQAGDGKEAWERFRLSPVRMVITDWMLPGMDGLELCRRVRSFRQDRYTYVILITARDNKGDVVEGFESGADDYISKPFDPVELRARLKTALRILRLEEEHKGLEQILVESRNKLRVVFDALPEEIVALDSRFRIISVNRAFQKRRGQSFSDIVGKPFFDHGDAKGPDEFEANVRDATEKVFSSCMPQFFIDARSTPGDGGKKYLEISCLPVIDEDGRVFQVVIVSRDITEEKRKAEEIEALNKRLQKAFRQIKEKNGRLENALKKLKEAQAQLLQSEKMASVGQLAAGVAHEINNPIGFISSNLNTLEGYDRDYRELIGSYRRFLSKLEEIPAEKELSGVLSPGLERIRALEEEKDLDFILEDSPSLIRDCQEGTERIKKIVLDLKDFAHPGEQELKYADINRNIESTLNVVWNELKYKATVKKDLGELPEIRCYPHQLNQVFMNLLVNAAQAIEDKGEITIRTRAYDGYVEIQISDTGVGIPKENLSRIFDPFFTTKEVGKGTGLGLNLAYNIIKKHKGKIEVESRPGEGTTFSIQIPVKGGR